LVINARQQRSVAPDVVALLAERGSGTHHHVIGPTEVNPGVALLERLERDRGKVLGAYGLQRPLDRASDWGADCVDDHGVGHRFSSSSEGLARPDPRRTGASSGRRPRKTTGETPRGLVDPWVRRTACCSYFALCPARVWPRAQQ